MMGAQSEVHNRNVRLRFNRNARLRFLCFSARTCNSCWKAAAELKRPRCLASRSGLRFVELARCLDGGGWGGGGFGGLARLLQPLATFGTFECSLLRASIVLGDLVTLTSAVAEFFQCNRITNATCFECFFLCYSRIGPSMRPCAEAPRIVDKKPIRSVIAFERQTMAIFAKPGQ